MSNNNDQMRKVLTPGTIGGLVKAPDASARTQSVVDQRSAQLHARDREVSSLTLEVGVPPADDHRAGGAGGPAADPPASGLRHITFDAQAREEGRVEVDGRRRAGVWVPERDWSAGDEPSARRREG